MKLLEMIKNDYRKTDMLFYTSEYSEKSKIYTERGTLLNADEHSKMSEMYFKPNFESKSKLIKWYFSYLHNMINIETVGVVGDFVRTGGGKKPGILWQWPKRT